MIVPDDSRAQTHRCLAAAFRMALACSIVGFATLYGPTALTRQVAFPAFSYATVILIVTNAALGDALRGCRLAAAATLQAVCPAILSLWLIGPARLTAGTVAAAVGATAFVVALPENTHLVSKRIALGQVVIVYVGAYVKGGEGDVVVHPVHVAASTALGVVACVLALLLPYPILASWEVRENCRLYTETASERLKLFVKAFAAEDNTSPQTLISQAKSLNKPANKFLQIIESKQESMQWEKVPCFKSYCKKNPGDMLQNLETVLRGMENALENCSEFPVRLLNTELKDNLTCLLENKILNRVKNPSMENSIFPESNQESENKKLFPQTLRISTIIDRKNLPSLFFIFCLKLLQSKLWSAKQAPSDEPPQHKPILSKVSKNIVIKVDKKRLMPALKCSLSLGFAVLFGSMYSKENGLWSGLVVAISLASEREATFKVANSRAQGTSLGTVYGVLGCFVFEKYVKIRFVSLLPWFVFSSFLRQSKMYGHAGGISAVIAALLILGRKNYGPPSSFAIARIVETFIGLSCSIVVDLLLQPTRASVLAKIQLSKTLEDLEACIGSITTASSSDKLVGFEKNLGKLKVDLVNLEKFIEEAEAEPNFWCLPFHSVCYNKIKLTLSKMVDFLIFGGHAIKLLEKDSHKIEGKTCKGVVVKLESDLKVFKDAVCSEIKCFGEVILVKSLAILDNKYEKTKIDVDLEMGRSEKSSVIQSSRFLKDGEAIEMSDICFLENLDQVVGDIHEEAKSEVILILSSLVYCMDGLLNENREIEKGIREILQWENPSMQVDLYEVLSKLHAMKKNVTI